MDSTTPTSAHEPTPTAAWARAASQLVMLSIDDPLWMGMLLRHLQQGGVIVIERSGDMLIMPGLDSGGTLNQ